jgi:diketogulonate reductase-like aldo/keto reductase
MSGYAGKQTRTQYGGHHGGSTSTDIVQQAAGKCSLVEQAYAPVAEVQQRASAGGGGESAVHQAAGRGVATPCSSLPHGEAIQKSFGHHDVSGIQAHVGGDAAASAAAMGADAYATGNHVVLGRGTDLFTVAHEAAHVVQQRGGVQCKGGVGEQGDSYERHADEVASLVVRGESAESLLDPFAGASASSAAAPGAAVQRKIGSGDNVIFGLSGRNKDDIIGAVAAGYTTFDGADSYANSIHDLAEAIEGKPRANFEVIYKVDVTAAEALDAHLRSIAAALGGYIDHALIHKVTDETQSNLYQPILATLKQEGLIKKVGAGDVKSSTSTHLASKDSFEIDANDLFLSPGAEELVEQLKIQAKPVFVYNIIPTLKKILQSDARPSQSQLSAMVVKIRAKVPTAEPILSSGTVATMESNLDIDTADDDMVAFEAHKAIETAGTQQTAVVMLDDMDPGVNERLFGFLFEYVWDAEDLFNDNVADVQKYATARAEKEQLFAPEELEVQYGNGQASHTLKSLLGDLFDSTGNCHRVAAFNFLTGA